MIDDGTLLRLRGRVRAIWVADILLRIAPFGEPELAALHELRRGCGPERVESISWMQRLRTEGFLEELPPASDDPDLARFDRLLNFLSELELRGHSRFDLLQRLRDSRVVVVGLGGLASWAVFNLLCCGVGNLTLVDGDEVELSNLNRSILYSEDDVGRRKVDAAADSIRRFSPRTTVETHHLLVTGPDDLVAVLDGSDLVIGLADQPPWLIKQWVAIAGQRSKVPVLQASGSRVGPFHREAGDACSICDWSHQLTRQPLYGEMLGRQARLPRGDSGALSPLGSVTGGLVAMEAVRHVLGLEPLTVNRVWEMDGDFTAAYRDCPKHDRCGACGEPGQQLLALPSHSMTAP
jgi:hypothetical protein